MAVSVTPNGFTSSARTTQSTGGTVGRTNVEDGTTTQPAAIANPDTYVNQAVTTGFQQGETGNQIDAGIANALENLASPWSDAQIQQAESLTGIVGDSPWTSATGNIAGWESQWENALDEVGAIAPTPVVTPTSTTLVPLTPPAGTSTTTGTSTTSTGTTGATTTSTSTTTSGAAGLFSQLTSFLSGLQGTSMGSGGAAVDSTGAGDVPGTSTPISSLGAITPIGTPTSTTSTGSPVAIIAVVLIIAIGVGVWIYERKKHKKPGATPAPAR